MEEDGLNPALRMRALGVSLRVGATWNLYLVKLGDNTRYPSPGVKIRAHVQASIVTLFSET